MKLETVVRTLAATVALTGGTAFAQHFAYEAPKDEEPEDEVAVPAQLSVALQDTPREDPEPVPEDPSYLPDIPIVVDGVKYTAREILEKNIHLSHYVVDAYAESIGGMLGFRTTDDLTAYFRATGQFPSEKPVSALCFARSTFHEHETYVGRSLELSVGWGYSYVGSRMNDRISSVKATPCGSWTVLFEHKDFKGYKMWLRGGVSIPRLANYGWTIGTTFWSWWNDRVSSLMVYW